MENQLTTFTQQIETALSNSDHPPEKWLLAMNLVRKKYSDCTEASVKETFLTVASLGLDPSPHAKEVAFLPRNLKDQGKCLTHLVEYRGLMRISTEGGYDIVDYGCIREGDTFEDASAGNAPTHRKGEKRRSVIGAYAVARDRDTGYITYQRLAKEEIDKRRKNAQTQGFWNDWEDEMSIKTAIRYVCERLPLKRSAKEKFKIIEQSERDITPDIPEIIDNSAIIASIKGKIAIAKDETDELFRQGMIESLSGEIQSLSISDDEKSMLFEELAK